MLNLFKSKPKPGYLGLTALGLMLMAALWLGAAPAGAQDTKGDAGAKASATATTTTTAPAATTGPTTTAAAEKTPVDVEELKKTCKGLKPYENLDELLYQFYINLDSDCLFDMPVEELEKIWDTKILYGEWAKPKNFYPLSETEFYNKPYKSERDAFFIDVVPGVERKNLFVIRITREYFEKHGSLFPDKKMPAQLPPPKKWGLFDEVDSTVCDLPNLNINPGKPVPICPTYYWYVNNKGSIKLNSTSEIMVLHKLVPSPSENAETTKRYEKSRFGHDAPPKIIPPLIQPLAVV